MQTMESCKENISPLGSRSSHSSSSEKFEKKELSLEQRRRIDQNFRAAKAIRSRKRPLNEVNEDSRSPLCLSPPTWAPLPFVASDIKLEHNRERQGMCTLPIAVTRALGSSNAQNTSKILSPSRIRTPSHSLLKTKIKSDFKLQGAISETESSKSSMLKDCATCNSSLDTSRASQDAGMPAEKTCSIAGTNQGLLPLQIEEALIQDSDLDENMLMHLDTLCSAGAPPRKVSMNRPLEQSSSSFSQDVSPPSFSTLKSCDKSAVLPEPTEDSVCRLYSASFTGVDSMGEMESAAKTCNTSEESRIFPSLSELELQSIISPLVVARKTKLEEVNQSHTADTCQDAKIVEQVTLQENMGILLVGNAISISSQGSCVGSRQVEPSSETNLPVPVSSPTADTTAVHISPSQSIPESCSSELSANILEMMPGYLQKLNDTQREAVHSDTHKPLLILAGPGSGKTSTMVARLLRLLSEGVQATNILAMTFTTAAATEMKERVGLHVGKLVCKELNVCTFHSFCLQLCRSNAERLGRSPEFLVYGHGQQRRAVIEATRLALPEFQSSKDASLTVVAASNASIDSGSDQLIDPRLLKERAKKWDKFVTQAKASGQTPEYFEHLGNVSGAAILRHYNATLASCDALDYHDFINCSVALLRDHHELRKQCLSRWTCLLVDEFQDTSKMQYELLCLLGSHKRITAVGDDDQSIFSFNGADSNNFQTFRKDFLDLKEVRLQHNYRSTRCIVEAATALIRNNVKRCEEKQAVTDNDYGELISVKECRNDDAQCCFVIDTILVNAQKMTSNKPVYGNVAVLYRRQVTGKIFQTALRSRKIPFNVHGIAFYRKKIVKTVISMLWTALDSDDIYGSRVFKALFGSDRAEAKKVVEYVDKVAKASKIGFLEAARRTFTAKVSGMFSRRQLACGRKVLSVIDAVRKLARKETTLSTVVTTVVNLIPQRAAFQKRAVLDTEDGKFLNEDDDPRSVLEYLLDDVTDFLSVHLNACGAIKDTLKEEGGCLLQLKLFLDHVTLREHGNFKIRREENKNSVTLTTLHQSKGLEWDTVFIVKANDSEIPLLHETRGSVCEGAMSLEEERRLFYVGMTRAKKKLYISHITWDSNQQLLRPSRFLKELPRHLLDYQVVELLNSGGIRPSVIGESHPHQLCDGNAGPELRQDVADVQKQVPGAQEDSGMIKHSSAEIELATSTVFLKGFNVDARSTIASIFHSWAKKPAFQNPKRLLDKVCFVLDERIRSKTSKNKDLLRTLKCCLDSDDALLYAQHVVRWMQIPQEERILMLSEKQEFFQQRRAERFMETASVTPKQVSFLRSLGCTIEPTSRLHASHLIEQYKKL